jgi:hypothetical protein
MNSALELLNQPIVLTILTITIGSYLLSVIADRRARNNKLRDEAINFLREASDHINNIFPLIYRQLRIGSVDVDQALEEGLTALFSKRIGIQVGSQAFLGSEEFYNQYFHLLDEIAAVIVAMAAFNDSSDKETTLKQVRAKRASLRQDWPMENDAETGDSLQPADEYIAWMDMIMQRTTHLLSTHLEAAMR